MREHYYYQHTDIMLYHCTKCNQGFHFKANKSKHHHACPKKDGLDQYAPRAPYDKKLEETFKRRAATEDLLHDLDVTFCFPDFEH